MNLRPWATALLWISVGCATQDDLDSLDQAALVGDAGSGAGGMDAGGAPPVVVDDSAETDMGQPISIDVLANDHDPEGGALTVTVLGSDWPFSRTTFDCGSDGMCWIEAYPHESGVGSFTYQACDPTGLCGEAVVTVTLRHYAVNVYAEDDVATTDVDAPVDIPVLANDSDNDGGFDTWSMSVIAGPWYGTATPYPDDRSIQYAPGPGYRGSDLFQYVICNYDGRCSTAWVYVYVDAGALAIARPDSYRAFQAVTKELYVVDNDTNLTAAPPVMTILVPPAHGQVSTDWGTIFFTADPDYVGTDFLAYQFCADGNCAASTVQLALRGNAEPTPVGDDIITDEDHPIWFNPLLNDTDPDGDPLHMNGPCWPSDWPFNRAYLDCQDSGDCFFTPAPQETGFATITCEMCDELYCVQETVNLTVLRVPNPPEGIDDAATTQEDTAVDINVLGNDAFNGGRADPTTMWFSPAPAHGTANVDVDSGIVTYTPAADYAGPDAFTYQICDVFGLCTSARVDVTVAPLADPPAYTAATTNTRQVISRTGVPVPLAATDPDGELVKYRMVAGSLPDHVALTSSGTFTSSGGHHKGTYLSTIEALDPTGLTATTVLTIIVR